MTDSLMVAEDRFIESDRVAKELYECVNELFTIYSGESPLSQNMIILSTLNSYFTVYYACTMLRPKPLPTEMPTGGEYDRVKRWIQVDAKTRYCLSAINGKVLRRLTPIDHPRIPILIDLGTVLMKYLRILLPMNSTIREIVRTLSKPPIIPKSLV